LVTLSHYFLDKRDLYYRHVFQCEEKMVPFVISSEDSYLRIIVIGVPVEWVPSEQAGQWMYG